MKKINFILFLIFPVFFSCNNTAVQKESTEKSQIQEKKEAMKTIDDRLVSLFDSIPVIGSILIYDAQQKHYFSNDFERAAKGFLPASTFKIPNSIIGLETAYLKDEKHIFKWNGQKQYLKKWEQDLNLKEAFHASCVPCYRELARGIGLVPMQEWTKKLGFGNMEVGADNLDLFWLEGDSRISQMEQIDFLKRFYYQQLPISTRTYQIMRPLMVKEKTDTYQLTAKTGLSIRGENYVGWYVGYVEKGENVYFFATNIEPKAEGEKEGFARQRIDLTMNALNKLDLID